MSDTPPLDYQTIPVGLHWYGVKLEFEPGFFLPGDTVRCEFRQWPDDDNALVTLVDGVGTQVEGDALFLWMTPEQTAALAGTKEIHTSPLLLRNGDEMFFDMVFSFDVKDPYTKRATA